MNSLWISRFIRCKGKSVHTVPHAAHRLSRVPAAANPVRGKAFLQLSRIPACLISYYYLSIQR